MDRIVNQFKAALASDKPQIGLWSTLSTSFTTEAIVGAGYDWLLLDTEHSPADPLTVLPQLQTIAGYPDVSAVVRPASNDPVLIKRFLDLGAQTLLIPFVQSAVEAQAAVDAALYPPNGFRGVSALTRATRFGRISDYMEKAADETCIIVQIETQAGLDNLEAIAAVKGVDALFVGPADLAASLGYGANQKDPGLRKTVLDTIARIKSLGKPAGLLTGDPVLQKDALAAGVNFLALGVDAGLLARGAEALRNSIE